jgi:MoaA/NifB/PqqE/SkfB family radical SAM enzyme
MARATEDVMMATWNCATLCGRPFRGRRDGGERQAGAGRLLSAGDPAVGATTAPWAVFQAARFEPERWRGTIQQATYIQASGFLALNMILGRLRDFVFTLLRRLRLAQHVHARWRHREYDKSVERFLRERTGVAERVPAGVVYEATMRCNLKCAFCYVGDLLNLGGDSHEELTVETLRKAFPERKGLRVSLTGGEVFVRKDVDQVLDLFRQKGYACAYLTTNGTMITDARASALADLALAGFIRHISVSIDGPRESHDAARGVTGAFERTAAGLRRLQAAASAKGAPLKVSINTTVARESLDALDRIVDVAEALGVDAIGLNHLMYATPDEVDQTLKILGETDRRLIATFVTADPGVSPETVSAQVAALEATCRKRRIRFDYRPKVHQPLIEGYYTPGTPLRGRCLYPFLNARVGFSGRVYFCPFIRIEVGDLAVSTLEEVWNSPRYVDLRRRLLERELFPVCRRCCKVELSPEPVPVAAAALKGRRTLTLTPVDSKP